MYRLFSVLVTTLSRLLCCRPVGAKMRTVFYRETMEFMEVKKRISTFSMISL
jgi:hypothetical protein